MIDGIIRMVIASQFVGTRRRNKEKREEKKTSGGDSLVLPQSSLDFFSLVPTN